MKSLRILILISLIISVCFGNECFKGYSFTQNLTFESFSTELTLQEDSTGIIQKRRSRRHRTESATGSAGFGIIGAEFVGSLVGGVGGAIIGGFSGFGLALMFGASNSSDFENYGLLIPTFISAAIGWTFGNTGGTCLVGSVYHQGGKFLPTLLGAVLGLPLFGIGTPFGSVIGYNLSRPKISKQAFLYQHFALPSFCFCTEKTKGNKIIPVLDFRLVNARF